MGVVDDMAGHHEGVAKNKNITDQGVRQTQTGVGQVQTGSKVPVRYMRCFILRGSSLIITQSGAGYGHRRGESDEYSTGTGYGAGTGTGTGTGNPGGPTSHGLGTGGHTTEVHGGHHPTGQGYGRGTDTSYQPSAAGTTTEPTGDRTLHPQMDTRDTTALGSAAPRGGRHDHTLGNTSGNPRDQTLHPSQQQRDTTLAGERNAYD